MNSDPFATAPVRLEELLEASVREILSHEDPERYRQWLRRELPGFAEPGVSSGVDDTLWQMLATVLGTVIWNATPLPGNRFRPAPMPSVGRNERCPCGSGRKFKQCCGGGPRIDTIPTELLWSHVLDVIPPEVLARGLAEREIPIAVLARHADILLFEGDDPHGALQMLRPLFEQGFERTDTEDHATAFDVYLNAFEELDREAEMEAWIARAIGEARRSPLRALAWQRTAALRIDDGDSAGAWQAFEQASRDDPDSLALARLEVLLLAADDRADEIPVRARMWLRSLRRRGLDPDDDLVTWLEDAIENPDGVMDDVGMEGDAGGGLLLRRWLNDVDWRPLPACSLVPLSEEPEDEQSDAGTIHAQLLQMGIPPEQIESAVAAFSMTPPGDADSTQEQPPACGPDSLVLVSPTAVRETERRWNDVFSGSKPFSVSEMPLGGPASWDEEATWCAFLAANPQAFDSVHILDDLVTVVMAHPAFGDPAFDRALFLPLLERVAGIVEFALVGVAGARLAWVVGRNRAALRSLVRLASWEFDAGDRTRALSLYERVVALNPTDNHGLRCILMDEYLRTGHDGDAVALAAQYPDDVMPETCYGKVLALFRLKRIEEAQTALAVAEAQLPKVAQYLLRSRVRKPELSADRVIAFGGEEQAWHYWEGMRGVWAQTPAVLAWLKRSVTGAGGANRSRRASASCRPGDN